MFAQLFLNKMSNQTICTNYTLISMLFFISYVHENVLHMDPLLINCIKTLIYYKRIDKKKIVFTMTLSFKPRRYLKYVFHIHV